LLNQTGKKGLVYDLFFSPSLSHFHDSHRGTKTIFLGLFRFPNEAPWESHRNSSRQFPPRSSSTSSSLVAKAPAQKNPCKCRNASLITKTTTLSVSWHACQDGSSASEADEATATPRSHPDALLLLLHSSSSWASSGMRARSENRKMQMESWELELMRFGVYRSRT
jgi:hypothetical protein